MRTRVRWVGAIVVGIALVAAVTWAVAVQTLLSPADVAADADAPDPGPVTVEVERRALEADVVVRGTVQFDEPITVDLTGQPAVDDAATVVATRIPQDDDEVIEGEVLLELSGRPVFALAGALPAYRDLRPGASGDDVVQLQQSLADLDLYDAEVDGEFGPTTQAAVEALYERAGHDPPGPSTEEDEQLRGLEDRVSEAQRALRQAERQRDDGAAMAEGADTASLDDAVEDAERELARARSDRGRLAADLGTWLPAGEVIYVPELPQRVDDVAIDLGDEVTGEALTISSPEIVIESSVPAEDVALVAAGDRIVIDTEDGERGGEITDVADEPGTGEASEDRHAVRIVPDDDLADDDLLDASLRIVIPVESTDGEVLAVPLAAVSADGGGNPRVEVLVPAADDDQEPARRLVDVDVGLTAEGLVEVSPLDDDLSPGDLVVVGRPSDGTDEDTDDDPASGGS